MSPALRRHPIALAAALAILASLAAAPAARAHQCVDVEILRAPDVAHAGQVIHVAGGVANCGDPARGFRISWVLVSENGDRRLLARAAVRVEPGMRVHESFRLLLPRGLRPGVYALVMVGEAPSGFTDRDARRIAIRPAEDGEADTAPTDG